LSWQESGDASRLSAIAAPNGIDVLGEPGAHRYLSTSARLSTYGPLLPKDPGQRGILNEDGLSFGGLELLFHSSSFRASADPF
jgi:hypothetical protein